MASYVSNAKGRQPAPHRCPRAAYLQLVGRTGIEVDLTARTAPCRAAPSSAGLHFPLALTFTHCQSADGARLGSARLYSQAVSEGISPSELATLATAPSRSAHRPPASRPDGFAMAVPSSWTLERLFNVYSFKTNTNMEGREGRGKKPE